MVLTGKQALDYSGGVSAEDNFGIGGFDRVMGPNGQAQYWAPDLAGAANVLFSHYEHSYVAPGERFPRRAETTDPPDRDVRSFSTRVEGVDFGDIGDDIFRGHQPGPQEAVRYPCADERSGRPGPFPAGALGRDARCLGGGRTRHPSRRLAGHADRDRIPPMAAFRPVAGRRAIAVDGRHLVSAVSKKLARAVNAASGSRPVVVLANLSGFDGSPESLRKLQLEYGAEIGRAVVNFDGPIVFCVVSRYHGGAFVVFSRTLNDELYVAAVEGSYASVIGGAPAAAVVFSAEVNARVAHDRAGGGLGGRVGGTEEEMAVLLAELERCESCAFGEARRGGRRVRSGAQHR